MLLRHLDNLLGGMPQDNLTLDFLPLFGYRASQAKIYFGVFLTLMVTQGNDIAKDIEANKAQASVSTPDSTTASSPMVEL